ncbi:PQQ-dependent sugar dehydrogenase [Caldilinea sp.]|uniref:PQQ-dependent sugar dehydrogenase n=1 Tax=Caldilinea sp. TaxID=2293560 RepID=UPI002C833565|nr:PQQ-dependent sugar dehydrogenase [Caldilinea sp.]HRA64370.1 PQQ-dependent sugar dehydrogenase [Caldilinea sp.]
MSDRWFKQVHSFFRYALALALSVALLMPAASPAAAQGGFNLPYGFIQEGVVMGLDLPTSFALAPDGRIFITEKAGRVRVYQHGELLGDPFIDLTTEVNDAADRGLMGIAVDPAWPQRPYVYLAFAYDPPEIKDRNPSGARVSRVVRLTADAGNLNAVVPGSGVVLVGTNSTADHVGNPDQGDAEPFSCRDEGGQPVRDCIATEGTAHTIDMLQFGPEGALYVSVGDGIVNSKGNSRALDINSLNGKILRVDPDTGEGLASNPFYDGDAGSNASKVFALGMRNPFRFTVDPRNGRVIVGEVGNEKWEEINIGGPGANFGWPCYEGPEEAATYANCEAFRSGEWTMTPGVHSYRHTTKPQRGAAIGGDLYLGRSFPALYRGAYFYHDFNGGVTNFLTFGGNGGVTDNEFATNMPGIVQITATDDALYVLSIILGGIWRIRYVPGGDQPPTADAAADPTGGVAPLEVAFSSKRSTDPEKSIVGYQWEFGDGESSSKANPSHIYTENGVYAVKLTVTDSAGSTSTDTVEILVGSEPPVAEILEPGDGAKFRIGEQVTYRGRGSDPDDGELNEGRLAWSGVLHHNEHIHYDAIKATGASGAFALEDHGDNTYLELCLTVTDSQSLQDQQCVDVKAQEVTYTFNSAPSGLPITYAGSRYETPFKVKTYIGAKRIVEAPLTAAGGLTFASWSDGGDAVHDLVIEDGDRVLTAVYTDASGEAPADATDEAALEEAPLVTPEDDAAPAADAPAEVETPAPAGSDAPTSGVPAASAGVVRAEVWRDVPGDDLDAFVKTPQFKHDAPEIVELARLAFPRGSGDSYGVRVRGYLVPPESGDYRFFISADDRGALSLSTDADPANKIVVAYTPDWTGPEVYDKYPEQATGPLALQAGARYYFEVLYKQADGKDNLFVAWERPGGEREVIDARYIEPVE